MSRFKDITKREIELAKDILPKADRVSEEKKSLRRQRRQIRYMMQKNFLTPPPCQQCGKEYDPSLNSSNIVIFPAGEKTAVFLCRSCMHPYIAEPQNAPLDFTPIDIVKIESPEKVWKSFERFYIALLTKHFRMTSPWDIVECRQCKAESVDLRINPKFKLGEAEVVCKECGYVRRIHIFKI